MTVIGPILGGLLVLLIWAVYILIFLWVAECVEWICDKWSNRAQPGKHPGHRNDGQQSGQYWDLEWSHPMADPRYFGEGP